MIFHCKLLLLRVDNIFSQCIVLFYFITDNVSIRIDGIIFLNITDPIKASYEVEDPEYSMVQLAQTSTRAEVAKIGVDDIYKEREALNSAVMIRCCDKRGLILVNDVICQDQPRQRGLGHRVSPVRGAGHQPPSRCPRGSPDAGRGREEEESSHSG